MGQPRSRRVEGWLLSLGVALLGSGCYGDRSPVDPLGGSELQRATVCLTERLESESFVSWRATTSTGRSRRRS
jgi:hypothetical protein